MTPKTIFCPLGAAGSPTEIDRVIQLCQEHAAHLSVRLFATAPSVPANPQLPIGDHWTREMDRVRDLTQAHTDMLRSKLSNAGVSADFKTTLSRLNRVQHLAGVSARVADITVASCSLNGAIDIRSPVIYGALFESARPLLVEPESDPSTPLSLSPERVVVAWDGRVQASRAVAQSISILEAAGQVDIVSIDAHSRDDDDELASAAELGTYLARYDISVDVAELHSDGQDVGSVLNNYASTIGAQLLVMGAYGHSRLRERLFGGTTERILANTQVPTFLVH